MVTRRVYEIIATIKNAHRQLILVTQSYALSINNEGLKQLLKYFVKHQESTIETIQGITMSSKLKLLNIWMDLFPLELEQKLLKNLEQSHITSLEDWIDCVFNFKADIAKLYKACASVMTDPNMAEMFEKLASFEDKNFELIATRISEYQQAS
jgi:hypothetical protein